MLNGHYAHIAKGRRMGIAYGSVPRGQRITDMHPELGSVFFSLAGPW